MRLLALLAIALASTGAFAQSKFYSAEDGWVDLSAFIDQQYGFLPVAVPINEPAVGLGVAGALRKSRVPGVQ